MSTIEVQCPHCGAVFTVDITGIRKKRLLEIFRFISEKNPNVFEAVRWIMRQYGVRRPKAIEYLKDLEATGYIKMTGTKLVPVQETLAQ